MNADEHDEWLMQRAGERALRRRRWVVGVLLGAMLLTLLVPVVQVFT